MHKCHTMASNVEHAFPASQFTFRQSKLGLVKHWEGSCLSWAVGWPVGCTKNERKKDFVLRLPLSQRLWNQWPKLHPPFAFLAAGQRGENIRHMPRWDSLGYFGRLFNSWVMSVATSNASAERPRCPSSCTNRFRKLSAWEVVIFSD